MQSEHDSVAEQLPRKTTSVPVNIEVILSMFNKDLDFQNVFLYISNNEGCSFFQLKNALGFKNKDEVDLYLNWLLELGLVLRKNNSFFCSSDCDNRILDVAKAINDKKIRIESIKKKSLSILNKVSPDSDNKNYCLSFALPKADAEMMYDRIITLVENQYKESNQKPAKEKNYLMNFQFAGVNAMSGGGNENV